MPTCHFRFIHYPLINSYKPYLLVVIGIHSFIHSLLAVIEGGGGGGGGGRGGGGENGPEVHCA